MPRMNSERTQRRRLRIKAQEQNYATRKLLGEQARPYRPKRARPARETLAAFLARGGEIRRVK